MSDTLEPESSSGSETQQPLNTRVLAAAFGIGLLAGAFLLFARGNGEAPSPTEIAAAKTSPGHQDRRDSASLIAERDRLESELESLKLQQEISALKQQLNAVQTTTVSTTVATPANSIQAPTAAATLDFWNRMNDVIEREGQMRAAPLGGLTSLNAGSFLDARVRAAEFAVKALRALNTGGVDARAVAVAETLAVWFEEGGQVAETGRRLLTRGSTQQRKGAAGQQYQAAEREHSAAVEAVNSEGQRVRQELSKAYGIDFPPLK